MKHKEYVTGVVTGVALGCWQWQQVGLRLLVHQNQSGSVLADSAHVEKARISGETD